MNYYITISSGIKLFFQKKRDFASISGATEGLPTVSQATAAGLCHPNCTHSFVAVGEFAQQEDFNADGRPKEGVNSPGREEKDNPEAWKRYRNSLKPKKAKKGPSATSKKKSASTTPATPKPAAKAPAKPAKATPTAVQPELPFDSPEKQQNRKNRPPRPLLQKREFRRSIGRNGGHSGKPPTTSGVMPGGNRSSKTEGQKRLRMNWPTPTPRKWPNSGILRKSFLKRAGPTIYSMIMKFISIRMLPTGTDIR